MQHRRIIKRGPIVLATNEDGSMDPSSPASQGLFLGDTRFLSLFRIHLNGLEPLLLGSSEESLFEASYLHINPEMTDLAPRPFSKHIDITPALPTCITDVVVDNLQIAGGCLGLHIRGEGDATLLEVRDNPDDLDITIHPSTRDHHRVAHGSRHREPALI